MASLLLLASLGTACAGASSEAEQPRAVVKAATVDLRKVYAVEPPQIQIPEGLDLPVRAYQPSSNAAVATEAASAPPASPHVSAAEAVSAPHPAAGAPNDDEGAAPSEGTSTPVPSPASDYPEVFTAAQMVEVFTAAGWPASEHARLLTLTHCESSWKPRAYNSGGPFYGFFQVLESNYIHFGIPEALWFDPVTNATVARWLWETGGYSHWPNC